MSILVMALVAPAVFAATDIQVAMPGFTCGPELPESKRDFFAEYLSERLSAGGGLNVVTAAQISAVLGAERQRQLLGCSENSAQCMTELSGALGSEVIVIGNLAKIGEEFAITLKAIDPQSSRALASASGRVKNEEGLLDFLAQAAGQLRAELLHKLRGVEPPTAAAGSRLTPRVWVPAALGVASLVASAVLYGLARGAETQLRDNPGGALTSASGAHDVASTGSTYQTASAVLLGVGLAAVGTAIVLFVLGNDAPIVSWLEAPARHFAWAGGPR